MEPMARALPQFVAAALRAAQPVPRRAPRLGKIEELSDARLVREFILHAGEHAGGLIEVLGSQKLAGHFQLLIQPFGTLPAGCRRRLLLSYLKKLSHFFVRGI